MFKKKEQAGRIIAATMAGGMIVMAAGTARADVKADLAGDASTNFTVGIKVQDAEACTLTVTPPAVKTFTFGWDKRKEGEPGYGHERISFKKMASAPVISVVATGGEKCGVNGLKLITRAGEGASGLPGNDASSMTKSFGNKQGMWAVRPLLSKITLYTAADKSAAAADTITVAYDGGGSLTQSEEVAFDADWWGGNGDYVGTHEAVLPAPQWFTAYKAYPPLLGGSATEGTVTWSTDKPETVYKAADFGINVMVGSDPLDSTGKPSLDVASDGDEISIPFTVTVSQA